MNSRFFSIDNFELSTEKRFGGSSQVLRALLIDPGQICALKYAISSDQDGAAAISFQREIDALGGMEHENIVRMLGIGTDEPKRFIVLEWLAACRA
jgi:serine/threonine protein kinase